ncbi:hypothetical protein BN946_scf185008.g105 [Trametes cinnabarina]|uniref:Uncharacterized protein n=1 Tax=Pycnoporus cinnabarinus TaxID=5643 RepID=A0A060SFT1_PYCCI|nr:hypothetical protein BN946_scf185008.g105 [Trametes cinnabarina]
MPRASSALSRRRLHATAHMSSSRKDEKQESAFLSSATASTISYYIAAARTGRVSSTAMKLGSERGQPGAEADSEEAVEHCSGFLELDIRLPSEV